MKVTTAIPGKFESGYRWASYLHAAGMLERLITTLPFIVDRHFGVPRAARRAFAPLGLWNAAVFRYAPPMLARWNQRYYAPLFDSIAARYVGECDLFDCWCTTALHSIRVAHRQGIPALLHTGSVHILRQTELLQTEYRRFGVDGHVTDPQVVRRGIAEYEEADGIVVSSNFAFRTFVESGVPEEKLFLVSEATVVPLVVADLERVNHSRVRILFVGRAELRKGVQYLLKAFPRVAGRATLRLVGPPPTKSLLRRLGGLPEGVEIAGVVKGAALAEEYRRADIFVLPSVEDGFGLVVSEAMAAGLPVVVSENAGSADLVDENVSGFVVAARSVEQLADRIELLVEDADLRQRMGRAARESVQERTWNAYGTELLEIATGMVRPTASNRLARRHGS